MVFTLYSITDEKCIMQKQVNEESVTKNKIKKLVKQF